MDQLSNFDPRGQKKQTLTRKLSQDEQDDWLILKKLTEMDGLSSSDSFEIINNIGIERLRVREESKIPQNLEVQILDHSFDSANGTVSILIDLSKSTPTIYHTASSEAETDELDDDFVDLK